MKCKDCQFSPKKRRGLSSIIGALLFVVLMVATFGVLGIALNTQTDIVSTARDVSDTDLKKQQEEFGIGVSTIGTEILSIDVNNVGQNPVEIFTVVMTNVTDVGFPTTIFEIPSDTSFIPSGNQDDIVSTLDLQMKLAPSAGLIETYNFKIISSLGTIKTATLQCSFTECGEVTLGGDLIIQLFADGPTGVNTKISTIIMFVTNTADFTYTDVQPTRGFTDTTDPPTTCNAPDLLPPFDPFWVVLTAGLPDVFPENVAPCDFDAFAPVDLQPGQTTLFKWDATISGDIDTVFDFCNGVEGKDDLGDLQTFPPGGEECDTLTIIDPNDCGGCGEGGATIILIDDLLIRPSLFMIIPSPFGIPNQPGGGSVQYKGLWGINVVNPTETPMTISKLTIAAYPPGSTPGDIVVEGVTSKCLIQDVSPGELVNPNPPSEGGTFRGFWSCPRINVIMWQNFDNPITIDPRSSVAFLANVKPGSISAGDSLDAVIVQGNVFTSSGSFGKAAYQTTMYQKTPDGGIVNVYLTADDPDPRVDLISQRLGILFNSTETFKIVFADMDDDPATSIETGAKLIVNVPREWKDVVVTDSTGFITNATQPSVVEHADSSTQIIALTDSPLGGVGDPVAKTLTFTTEAPDISKDGVKRLYIMYVLADGLTETGISRAVGPLNEIVLQVLP